MKKIKIKVGTRGSKLSVAQTSDSLERLRRILPCVVFGLETISTPGDRDRKTDLRVSPADFFTKDLDDAILSGRIDCAVSSAKDLPDPMPEGIDWFWLPWHEDPRDVIIMPKPQRHKGTKAQGLRLPIRIGVSSGRREEYCRKRFPEAELLPIRGNIDDRIAQLDAGKFDMLIMAAAGMKRLGLEHRISESISETVLVPPEGQGWLALTYRKGDRIFNELRKLFVKSVVFAGAGPGDADLATAGAVDAMGKCNVCLYDALSTPGLLKHLPPNAKAVYVGKRSGHHSLKQNEINDLIAKFARQGKNVVRLKGGDPTIFGRLAEEVETLDNLALPYRVIPGVSSLNAVGATGLMLTRRGLSRGFSVMTPRRSGSSEFQHVSKEERLRFPSVFFMGLSETANIAKCLIKDGRSRDEPAAIVLSAGIEAEQRIIAGTLGRFASSSVRIPNGEAPGIFIVGENADSKFILRRNGALQGKRVLLTCSDAIMEKAIDKVRELGGIPVKFPLIELKPVALPQEMFSKMSSFSHVILTSPSAVKIFMESMLKQNFNLRKLPKVIVCGPGTACEFRRFGILPDIEAAESYGAEGMLKTLKGKIRKGDKILRLCSDKAGKEISCELRKAGAVVTDEVICRNIPVKYDKLPEFDAVVFASSSAVESFQGNFGLEKLRGKYTVAIGKPTLETIRKLKHKDDVVLAKEATINGCVESLAERMVEKKILNPR